MEIVTLAERPDLVFPVARWLAEERASRSPLPLSWTLSALEAHLRRDAIPATLVLVDRGVPLGAVGIACHDPTDHFRPDQVPWITSLYVIPGARQLGHGSRLLHAAERHARALGHPRAYLRIERGVDWFQDRGWSLLQVSETAGRPVYELWKRLRESLTPPPLDRRAVA